MQSLIKSYNEFCTWLEEALNTLGVIVGNSILFVLSLTIYGLIIAFVIAVVRAVLS